MRREREAKTEEKIEAGVSDTPTDNHQRKEEEIEWNKAEAR